MKAALLLPASLLATVLALSAATESFNQTHPLSAGGKLSLENVNGNVEIVAWDKAEVSIEAEKKCSSEEKLKDVQIKVTAAADKITIRTEHTKKLFNWNNNVSVSYRIRVPASTRLDSVETVNGNVKCSGVSGDLHIETVNGSIEASDLQGNAHLELVNGSVHASATKLPAKARIHIETVNGSCDLALPADAGAELSAETVNGKARCELPLSNATNKRNELSGTIGNGGATVKLESVNGSVSVLKL
jgi:DUF4097 and DUF4098 domain-containing protein YvlB